MAHSRVNVTYCWTEVRCCARTTASSLIKWGRLAVDCSWRMTAATISSWMPSRSILGATAASGMSTLVAGVGESGGVGSTAAEPAPCDRLRRLFGCDSGDSERTADGDVDADDEVGRAALLLAAAARAALVTGMCMPRLGRDSDLRRVLYGMAGGGGDVVR